MNEVDIFATPVPAWYELDLTGHVTGLAISVHPDIQKHLIDPIYLQRMQEWRSPVRDRSGVAQINLPQFVVSDDQWGFGGVASWRKCTVYEGWFTLDCPLPTIRGKGQDKHLHGFVLSASLGVLFDALFIMDDIVQDSRRYQLMVIQDFSSLIDLYGATFVPLVTPQLVKWLRTQPDGYHHPVVAKTMRAAWMRMWRDRESNRLYDETDYPALFRSHKWINLSCPGNACGLDPEDYYDPDSPRGYYLLPHNTDSPLQQLTLLVGLAAIHRLARQDGY